MKLSLVQKKKKKEKCLKANFNKIDIPATRHSRRRKQEGSLNVAQRFTLRKLFHLLTSPKKKSKVCVLHLV